MSQDYGDIDIGDAFDRDKDLINAYLEIKELEETSDRNYDAIRRELKENSRGTAFGQFLDEHDIDPLEATVQDIYEYKDALREKGLNDGGIDTYLGCASFFYNYLMKIGVADSNPAGFARSKLELDTDSPDRVYVTVGEMEDFVKCIVDPQFRAIALLLLKTGIRRGECVNIDLCCLHLDDSRYRRDFLEYHDISLHQDIRDRPDSIFIYADINEGDVVNGEKREDGNKRKRKTVIPIDEELKKALLEWLSIRPRTPEPHPLFTTTACSVDGEFGRLGGDRIYAALIRNYARDFGLADTGYDPTDVDVHYFRHFFSTQMRRHRGDHDGGIDRDLVKYIRGDVMDDDILSIYTHDAWGVNVRETYLENIYTFNLYD